MFRPRTSAPGPAVVLALYGIVACLALTAHQLATGAIDGAGRYYSYLLHGEGAIDDVTVPYGSDLLGTLLMLVFLVCPSLFVLQVRAIDNLVTSMTENGLFDQPAAPVAPGALEAESSATDRRRLDAAVSATNHWFARIGSKPCSLAIGVLAVGTTAAMLWSFDRFGIYEGQLRRVLADDFTKEHPADLYERWWMGTHHAGVYWGMAAAAAFYFYLLYKELLIGVAFSYFAYQMVQAEIFYTPNLRYNSDGFWGMRGLRNFIRTTYTITLVEVTAYFTVFWFIQAPKPVTLVLGLVVITGPVTFVVLPTLVARQCVIKSKRRYVRETARQGGDTTAQVWDFPNLPFGSRKIASATLISLVFPALLIVLGSLTKTG